MYSNNKIRFSWLLLAVILGIIAGLIFFVSPTGQENLLFLAVLLLFIFAVVWYIPHFVREQAFEPTSLPAVYFVSGTVLIVLGCISSALFPTEIGGKGQWSHIAEVLSLVLGAVVGGTYCCNAILGQDFDGKTVHLGVMGALAGAIPILATLLILCLPPADIWVSMSILGVVFIPSLTTLIIKKSHDNKPNSDGAFRIFLAGLFLIFVTGVTAVQILPAVMNLEPRLDFISAAQSLSIVKNLVSSYCGAIGAGLITRGMERNTPKFVIKDWATCYFEAFNFESALDSQVEFVWKDGFRPAQRIVMTLEDCVLQEMGVSSSKRAQYGKKLHIWLRDTARHKSHKNSVRVALSTPKVGSLNGR